MILELQQRNGKIYIWGRASKFILDLANSKTISPQCPFSVKNYYNCNVFERLLINPKSLHQKWHSPSHSLFTSWTNLLFSQLAMLKMQLKMVSYTDLQSKHYWLTILLETGKDPQLCGPYQPISLLTSDYKILSKLLALRLEKVLPNLINMNQMGFIQGRSSFGTLFLRLWRKWILILILLI